MSVLTGLPEKIRNLRPSVVTGGAASGPLLVLFGLNAVDELDREAFTILIPKIRDHFGLDIQGVLTLTSLVALAVLFLEIPLAHVADRKSRTKIAAAGAAVWGIFSILTGFAPTVVLLGLMRIGAGLGRTVVGATHFSLLSDYYPVDRRPAVYAFHRAANSVGQFFGPIMAGVIAYLLGWRAPFILFGIPTLLLVLQALRLKEPVRGNQDRRMMGASEEVAETEEEPASFSEAWRILWQVRSLRRIWLSLPIVGVSLVAIRPLVQLFYEQEFGLNEIQRGTISAIAEPFQLVGYFVGIPIAMKLMKRDAGLLLRFMAATFGLTIVSIALLVLAQNLVLAVVFNVFMAAAQASLAPALATAFSLAIPPRVRSVGGTIGNLFIVPAFLFSPIVGGMADAWGIRTGMLAMLPVLAIGVVMLATAGSFTESDIARVRTSTVAMAEVRAARKRGDAKLLLVKGLDVGYDGVQVLFNVDMEVGEGEIIALLGTNGAGKSTLLKAISGILEPTAGATIFDGADTTFSPPNEVVARGIVQVPGGKGVFPSLTVAENLRIAGWIYRRDEAHIREATARVLEYFPVLKTRWEQPAGNLSGGEQQMLTLGMAFVAKPRLLMIDELSLGLAPIIVEQLLAIVRAIRDQGTTIIVVEQSVNVALTIAETAYFMEKGEIRFRGPTSQLLGRTDILRSVFLEGAGAFGEEGGAGGGAAANAATSAALPATAARPSNDEIKPALQVRRLGKSYGGVHAVRGVSFDVAQGSILGFIGANGAGKTTLFDLISGFVPADEGQVVLNGWDVSGLSPDGRARLGLGRSFQDARLFPGLTVRETIATALERQVAVKDPVASALALPSVVHSERQVQQRVDELLDLMRLGAYRNKFISELSTGTRRIVDLACVLAHEPTVLLFDEPSSGIAQRETEALAPLLLRIRDATGASLLVIEHDMPLITSIADDMIALELGQKIAQGPAADVVRDPAVVASYLGTSEEVIARSGTTSTRRADRADRRRRRRAAAGADPATTEDLTDLITAGGNR
ncbi:MAG TPA: MFS transporter [Acidimicrobiales bacterium]|nr:MFS transporter [Acidimicrobiales bacterium]